jgi:prepilin-type processing-associated H-X9-DG protein
MYNCCGFDRARLEPEDKYFNLAGKQIGWVPNPSSFILMYEPPARSFTIIFRGAVMRVFQNWHYSTQTTDWPEIYLPSDPSKFIAPVLFVDGHVASFDFSSSIRPDPRHVFEPTKNWTWYKPAPQSAPTLGRGD